MVLLFLIRRLGAAALVLALAGCAGLFFYPLPEHVRTPRDIGLAYEDIVLEADDGVRLHAWYLPAAGSACARVLFLHGNAENVSTHIASVYWLPARGFDVLLLDYRGYGASRGSPSFRGIQLDIDAAVRYLHERRDRSAPIVVFGQSLGGAAAIRYVAHSGYRRDIRALVVESAFSSPRAIAQEKLAGFWLTWPFQWLPRLTLSDAYSPLASVARVSPIPLLLVHGEEDGIVPIAHAERLYGAAREPKELWRVPGGHIQAFRTESMRDRLVAWLSRRACPDAPADD